MIDQQWLERRKNIKNEEENIENCINFIDFIIYIQRLWITSNSFVTVLTSNNTLHGTLHIF